MPKSLKKLFILILIFSWIFSGWPQIFNFPPGIQEARAALPTFVAAGVVTKGLGAITPGMPSGVLTNDVLLLFIETADQAITVSGGTETWTAVTGSPVTGAVGTDLTVFWARASQDTPTSPTTSDSGDHQLAVILAFRGVITSGNPWDVVATGTAGSGTSVSFPSVITTVADTFVVHALAGDGPDGNSTVNLSGETNANLTNLTERSDERVNTGNGGLLGTYTGEKASAGSVGNTTATLANAATQAMITIALKPAPSTVTVGTTGTQTSSMLIPSTNQYVGGAFTFIRNESTANVTSIVISETGTVNANSNLSNLQLYYKQEVSCSASIPVDATVFNATGVGFDASENATVTGTMTVGTSQICVYVELDVGVGASDSQTLEIEITDPSTEVTVSAGVVSPATAVAIAGATTINLAPAVRQDHFRWRNDNGPQGDTSQTLYFNPTGNGFAMNFTIVGGCTAGSEWDCVDDGTADTQSTAPTSDLETSQLKSVNGKSYYTLVNDALPAGATVTQLDITASGVDDVGNPNTSLTLGYCTTCDGATDVMGTAQAVTGADQTKTQQFASLTLSTTDMNNMQLVVQGSGVNAEISTLYVLVTYTVPAATWRQAEDIVETGLAKSTNIRLRFQIDNTGGSANSYNYRLEWAAQSGTCDTTYTGETYAAVPDVAGTEHFDMTLSGSSLFVDGDSTTAQLSNAEAFTFVAGDQVESTSNQSGAITLAQNQYTEVEYVFQANANATDGGVYCFRVTNAGTALNSADVIAQVTLAGGGGGPTLTFSLGANSVALGNLSASAVTSGSHTITVGTNAENGVAVTYSGSTLTSGGNTITAMSTVAASSIGTEQFGINAKDNATPNVGAECSGTPTIAAAATGYATVDNFKFVSGETIVSSAGSINDTTCTISYIANITTATEAGSYSATLTYTATGNF